MNKPPFSVRLSRDARAILKALANKLGVTQAAVIELALREMDSKRKAK